MIPCFHRYHLFIFLLCFHTNIFAKEITRDQRSDFSPQILKVFWENDVFLLSDREYTNGGKIEYGRYERTYAPPALLLLGLETLIPGLQNPKQEYTGVSLTHNINTPLNLYASDIAYGERPYSSYGLISNNSTYTFEKSSLSFEISLGQMGPAAQGKYFQGVIHKLTNSPLPQGWDNQIGQKNLYQFNTDWKYFWIPNLGIQTSVLLGNLDTSVTIGPIFRYGHITSPVSHGMNINDFTPAYNSDETEYYFFIRPSFKHQSINGTLGNSDKTQLNGLYSPGSSDSLLFNEGKVTILGEPMYNSIFEERSSSTMTRFLVYQNFVAPENSFAMNFLIFNTIFNGATVPDNGLKLALLQTLASPDFDSAKYPGLGYFLYDTLFRDQSKGISVFSKLLAFQYFYSNGVTDEESRLATILLLSNEQNAKSAYHVDLQRMQGKLSTGFVYQSPTWFFQLGLELSTLEYRAPEGVYPIHRYTTVQIGRKF